MRTVFYGEVECKGVMVEVVGHNAKPESFLMLTIHKLPNTDRFTMMTLDAAKELARTLDAAVAAVQAAQEDRSDG